MEGTGKAFAHKEKKTYQANMPYVLITNFVNPRRWLSKKTVEAQTPIRTLIYDLYFSLQKEQKQIVLNMLSSNYQAPNTPLSIYIQLFWRFMYKIYIFLNRSNIRQSQQIHKVQHLCFRL